MIKKRYHTLINKETGEIISYNGIKQENIRSRFVANDIKKKIERQFLTKRQTKINNKILEYIEIKEEIISYKL